MVQLRTIAVILGTVILCSSCEDAGRASQPRVQRLPKPTPPPIEPPKRIVEEALAGQVSLRGRSLATLLRADSVVSALWDLQYAKHPQFAAIRDSLRPLLAEHYAPRARDAIARLPDLDRFVELLRFHQGNRDAVLAFGPRLGLEERGAIEEMHEVGRWSSFWAPQQESQLWATRGENASQYRSWKRDIQRVAFGGTSQRALLSRHWSAIGSASLYSPEFLPNGRISPGGGRWWFGQGSSVKGGMRYGVLCIQKDKAGSAVCKDYIIERTRTPRGSNLLLVWGEDRFSSSLYW